MMCATASETALTPFASLMTVTPAPMMPVLTEIATTHRKIAGTPMPALLIPATMQATASTSLRIVMMAMHAPTIYASGIHALTCLLSVTIPTHALLTPASTALVPTRQLIAMT
jgi:hypothetical protein